MPFTRKAPRKLSNLVISLSALTRANWQVTEEMEKLGLWHKKLDKIDVYLVPLHYNCYGWFMPEDHIYIPATTGANLCDFFTGHHTRLTDVLRHEWAHALADRRPGLVVNKHFRRAFGGHYESPHPVWEYHPDLHLTKYAASMPCEDFAETFHYYLRHKGKLPVRLQSKDVIVQKWEFIDRMTTTY